MDPAPFTHLVTSEEELRATDYPEPPSRAWAKEVAELDEPCAAFLERSPLAFLGTSDDAGRTTVTPRGGPSYAMRLW